MRGEGFTLIELLVVVLIISILAAVALPQYQLAVEKSVATEGITLLRSIALANQAYYLEHGNYTTNLLELGFDFPGKKTESEAGVPSKTTKYFSCRPTDVNGASAYLALCRRNNKYYFLVMFRNSPDVVVCRYDQDASQAAEGEKWCQRLTGKQIPPYTF